MVALLPVFRRSPAERPPPGQETPQTTGDLHLRIELDAKMFCCSCCEGQLDSECRAVACLRLKIDRTIVKLHDAKGGSQADSAASGPSGEEQLKNLLPVFRGNALAGIGNADFREFAAPLQHQAKFAAVG